MPIWGDTPGSSSCCWGKMVMNECSECRLGISLPSEALMDDLLPFVAQGIAVGGTKLGMVVHWGSHRT